MPTNPPLLLENDGPVALLTLNRPERHHVLDVPMAQALIAAVTTVQQQVAAGTVRAVLLRATGRGFCAGGDISGFAGDPDERAAAITALLGGLNDTLRTLAELPVPVISAVNGAVGGGGLGLAFCADFVVASDTLVVRGGYTAIGLTPDVGASWQITRLIGPARAKRLFFCNEKIDAATCLQWGLVSEVVPEADLPARTLALAQRLAAGARHAIARTKALVDAAPHNTLAEHLHAEAANMTAAARDPESAEGVAAFIARRPPRFPREP